MLALGARAKCPSRWALMHVNTPFFQVLTPEFCGTWVLGVLTCLNGTPSILCRWRGTSAWALSVNTALNMGLRWEIMTWFLTGTTRSSGRAYIGNVFVFQVF